jgi:hypothetical protein
VRLPLFPALLLIAPLAACNARHPIALGPDEDIAAATRAARRCGIVYLRHDPLSPEESLLLIGDGNASSSVACTIRWIRMNKPALLLTADRRRALGL